MERWMLFPVVFRREPQFTPPAQLFRATRMSQAALSKTRKLRLLLSVESMIRTWSTVQYVRATEYRETERWMGAREGT
jgi:hypothetical protein